MKPAQNLESDTWAVFDRLGIAEDPMTGADPVSFLRSLAAAGTALMKNPSGVAAANARLMIGLAAAVRAAGARLAGQPEPGPASPVKGDKRFDDAAFAQNPLYFLLAQQYLLANQLVTELLEAASLDAERDLKARFASKFILDALAPTNTLPGNPAALREAFNTGGLSVLRGAKNMLDDLRHNKGWPAQVDATGFEVGVTWLPLPASSSIEAT